MAFPQSRSAPVKLSNTASFKQYFDHYSECIGLSENVIASFVRINQPRLNKITNGKIKNVDIPTLVSICLVFGLNENEARDFLSRRDRAFNPSNKVHDIYIELIRIYSEKVIDYKKLASTPEKLLEEADSFLISNGQKPLPVTNN